MFVVDLCKMSCHKCIGQKKILGTVSSVCKYFASKGYKPIENHQFFNSLISNICAANKNAVTERIIQILDLNENNNDNDVDKIAMELSKGVINMIKEKHFQFKKRQEKLESQLKSCNFFEKLLSQNIHQHDRYDIYQSEQSDNDHDSHNHHSHGRHHPHRHHHDHDDYNVNFAYKNHARYFFDKRSGRGHGHGEKSRSRFRDIDDAYECKKHDGHGAGNFNSYGKHYVIGVCGKYGLESMKHAARNIIRIGSEFSCEYSVCDIIIFEDRKLFCKNISKMQLKKDCKCVTYEWLNDCLQCNQFIDIDKTYQLSLNHHDADNNVNNENENENKNDNENSNDDHDEEVTVQTRTSSRHRARKRQFDYSKISMMDKFCIDDYDYVCDNYNHHDHYDQNDDDDVPPKKRQKLLSSQSNKH